MIDQTKKLEEQTKVVERRRAEKTLSENEMRVEEERQARVASTRWISEQKKKENATGSNRQQEELEGWMRLY